MPFYISAGHSQLSWISRIIPGKYLSWLFDHKEKIAWLERKSFEIYDITTSLKNNHNKQIAQDVIKYRQPDNELVNWYISKYFPSKSCRQ